MLAIMLLIVHLVMWKMLIIEFIPMHIRNAPVKEWKEGYHVDGRYPQGL